VSELLLYFSLLSGDIYHVEADEVKNLDKSQMPLLKRPNPNCNKCYGRFYTGFETIKKYYVPCPKCMRKCVDWERLKDGDLVIETPKTTNEIADHEFIMAAEGDGIEGQ